MSLLLNLNIQYPTSNKEYPMSKVKNTAIAPVFFRQYLKLIVFCILPFFHLLDIPCWILDIRFLSRLQTTASAR